MRECQAGEARASACWFSRLPHLGQNLGSRPRILRTSSKGVSRFLSFFLFRLLRNLAASAIRYNSSRLLLLHDEYKP
ncbi:hypothetical protein SAMN06298221_1092 [Sphaerochaeta associata]|uniref:Uncharacterized protein n=1 Tax=Sphaerochaeta associata TaxID=1129264 RepID=A0ABY4DDT4_9SPIR|nr:hypothetical protein [Sphaerochaeta associata]UOM51102.1 hypothetical protein MUG09_16215 [Sphaerochaeta associata]SMP56369.1 hypothetical protein SAMN06298221_1092 [Sphaerochaeta associata]